MPENRNTRPLKCNALFGDDNISQDHRQSPFALVRGYFNSSDFSRAKNNLRPSGKAKFANPAGRTM